MWIDSDELNEILNFAYKYGIDFDVFEGCLQDNFIFYNHNFKNADDEKYVIIKEVALNEWSSGLKVILTNSNEEAQQFIELYAHEESAWK